MRSSLTFFGISLVALSGAGCASEPDPCADPGTACVWAGTGKRGFNIEAPDAHRLDSKLYYPADVTFGPDDRAYIVDYNNHRVRRVETNDALTVVIGADYEGDGPPEMEDRLPVCNPAGAPATTVALNHPTDAEFGPDGLLYLAAWHNNKIRVFDPATGMMTALAGDGYGYTGDGGPACRALFNQPKAVAFGPDGTLYTVDQRNVRIRAISMNGERTITTMAGSGQVGHLGDGGPAREAQLGMDTGTTPQPTGSLVVDGQTLYVADTMNHRIRRIDLVTGTIDCIGGTGQAGYSGDGGKALDATFNSPTDLELGPDGRLYIADRNNHVVRALDPATGDLETVVGTGVKCDTFRETCGDRLPARQVALHEPYGVAFDAAGNLYVADSHNHRILKVTR